MLSLVFLNCFKKSFIFVSFNNPNSFKCKANSLILISIGFTSIFNLFKYFNNEDDLKKEYIIHEKNKILNRSDNAEFYKKNIFNIEDSFNDDNDNINSENNNYEFYLNQIEDNYDEDFASYINSDLNLNILLFKNKENNLNNNTNNYYPGFSFSTSDEEEVENNKL